jgi:predicted phosphodiesterase
MNLKPIVSVLLVALNLISFGQTEAVSSLHFIVEPYLQQVEDDSFHVLWETSSQGKGIIKLGVAEFNVLKPKLNRLFQEEASGTLHRVIVDGLNVDENYFYQTLTIGEKGDTLMGPVTPLHIPNYNRMPVSFAVVGDTQNSPAIWGHLSELIYQERPSFIVHVGDLVQNGYSKTDWVDEFFKPARNLFRFYPFYSAIGNHEQNHANYYQYVDFPGNEWFYTVKKGNVLFVFVDTNKDILPGSEQYSKLQQVLAASPETWKIMVHHQPVYVSEEGFYGNTWFQRNLHGDPNEMHLKKLYETYGVDVVLNGHAHFYERTWPLRNDRVDAENGVTYVTTGGGNDEYSKHAANKAWYDARTRVTNHFLYLSIVGEKLYGRAIDSLGNTFDDWTIEKKAGYKRLNAPLLTEEKQYFIDTTSVKIQNLNKHGNIIYQLAGNQIQTSSNETVRFPLKETTTVSASIQDGEQKSFLAEKTYVKMPVLPAVKKEYKGVKASYVEGNWIALPDFEKVKPLKIFDLDSVSLQPIQPRAKDHFAVRFTGSLLIPETNVYRFLLESFDGSKLLIDGQEIISNDGIHYEIKKENFVALEKGLHSFEIQYFDYVRRETLNIWIGTKKEQMMNLNKFLTNGK